MQGNHSLVVVYGPILNDGLHALLARHPGWNVCGVATHAKEVIEKIEEHRPGVVILGINPPEKPVREIISEIRKIASEITVVIVSLPEAPSVEALPSKPGPKAVSKVQGVAGAQKNREKRRELAHCVGV
jgi:chemotaxis response regulator CheB